HAAGDLRGPPPAARAASADRTASPQGTGSLPREARGMVTGRGRLSAGGGSVPATAGWVPRRSGQRGAVPAGSGRAADRRRGLSAPKRARAGGGAARFRLAAGRQPTAAGEASGGLTSPVGLP